MSDANAAHSDAAPDAEQPWARRVDLVVLALQERLGGTIDPTRIRAEVEDGFAEYAQATVRDFVPVLVEARVRSRLTRSPLGVPS